MQIFINIHLLSRELIRGSGQMILLKSLINQILYQKIHILINMVHG